MSPYTQLMPYRDRRLIQLRDLIEAAHRDRWHPWALSIPRWRAEFARLKLKDEHERLRVVR